MRLKFVYSPPVLPVAFSLLGTHLVIVNIGGNLYVVVGGVAPRTNLNDTEI